MKILIVDDHAFVRHGLKAILKSIDENANFVDAVDCENAMEIINSQDVFDMVLLDIYLPDTQGLKCLEQVLRRVGNPVVIVSTLRDPKMIWDALKMGARGFVCKGMRPEQMEAAFKIIHYGGHYIPSEVLAMPLCGERTGHLTRRQTQVLELIAQGLPNQEIADQIGCQEKTIRSHLTQIYKFLKVKSRAEAIKVAQERGVIE
ncbi:DNA-binding response regulator [Ectothiorhodospiraceae bacterium BW-2]|nr:DNA-binding response regulator [Ectothiorhodospiraceae bacterium BW-2]